MHTPQEMPYSHADILTIGWPCDTAITRPPSPCNNLFLTNENQNSQSSNKAFHLTSHEACAEGER